MSMAKRILGAGLAAKFRQSPAQPAPQYLKILNTVTAPALVAFFYPLFVH
ncbi:hypothetical protein SAMN05216344_1088 [Polaromonas sp. OV174]|nr:hypothetical protein [Polaromonas sp. OV174]SFC05259.1 hypothetical protein SAMN05216344_1088 [Polaromonas sp. OV174]